MMKKYYQLFMFFFIILLIFSISCKEQNNDDSNSDVILNYIYGKITDTFSGKPLSGVEIKIDYFVNMTDKEKTGEYMGTSDDNGNYEIMIGKERGYFKIYVNFDKALSEYIPSIMGNGGGFSGKYYEATPFHLVGNEDGERVEINIDIVKFKDLNPRNYDWEELLDVYRGSGDGPNDVWVKRPDRFIVYDPHNVLKQYNDPKRNPVMDNIMKGFRAADEYSCGVVRAPSLDEIEIKYEESHWSNGDMFFEITDGDAYETEFVDNNEIKRSGAGGGPYALTQNFVSEIVSSIQGGDNEGDAPSIFGANVHLTKQDKNWGRFNYKLREPGSYIALGTSNSNRYGFTYEIRNRDEIIKLKAERSEASLRSD